MAFRIGFIFALVAAAVSGQVPPSKAPGLQRVADAWKERAHIPALSISVQSGGPPDYAAAWGYSDLENFVPATPKTVFRLASLSKPFTAVAALKLVEAGKLDLDAEIQRYLPSFPRKQWPITTRQLLSHLSGIRAYEGDEINITKHYSDLMEGLEIFAKDPLLYEPGTKYHYSTYGFNVAGAVVQAVAGVPFATFVEQQVLKPSATLTMRPDSVFDIIPNRARGYYLRPDGQIQNCGLADTSYKLPGGGWVATATDITQFARALMDEKLLRPETLDLMWSSNKLKDGSSNSYGLGWNNERRQGLRLATHSGGQQGTSTFLILCPERKISIVVLANLESAPVRDIALDLFDEMVGSSK
ncbi:serine hydrolase domain-containing protein [Paludibaculum fermentans]|uniref:Beta-lactamase family protein n=1 Tax=Paludibaculum fermentans TaxID=1473598 RepID=A0A7S7SMH2_PALFE|nr:serine hydrolase domain-containing protein [Paludibaculum fermentans]QOY90444.1 beta-lactamase family protein [Paludibaculum fermentans]